MSAPLMLSLIAGEPSGDRLGAALMRALRAERPDIRFAGVGGREMTAAGLTSLFDIIDLNVMGIAEVVPRLRSLIRRINQTAADVVAGAPDALITIDSPSFGLRVAEKVRARAPAIRTIHYVAPSVWAWRPGRAKHMARFVDHVLAVLPFEPPYMTAAGMTCDFVGHPIAEREPVREDALTAFRRGLGISPDQPLMLVAPGSRKGEVQRMAPIYRGAIERLSAARPDLRVAIPVVETVVDEVRAAFGAIETRADFVMPEEGEAAKFAAFAAADFALVTSGTITLEMAAAGTPHVSAFRTSWLTAAIVRRVLKVDTANLVNLIAGEKVVPEFLQEFCTVESLTGALMPLMQDPSARNSQAEAGRRVMAALGGGGEAPSRRAARSVLAALR